VNRIILIPHLENTALEGDRGRRASFPNVGHEPAETTRSEYERGPVNDSHTRKLHKGSLAIEVNGGKRVAARPCAHFAFLSLSIRERDNGGRALNKSTPKKWWIAERSYGARVSRDKADAANSEDSLSN